MAHQLLGQATQPLGISTQSQEHGTSRSRTFAATASQPFQQASQRQQRRLQGLPTGGVVQLHSCAAERCGCRVSRASHLRLHGLQQAVPHRVVHGESERRGRRTQHVCHLRAYTCFCVM
eukprot:scaffold149_cov315-Pinguiococcus_pyrenoidosus.AAC.84